MYRYFLITICLLVTTCVVNAQVVMDTTGKKFTVDLQLQAKRDSLRSNLVIPKVKKERVFYPDSTHSPKKAVMHSLMIPGWGQVYNHRWWKVPAIYGVLGLISWAYLFNRTYYDETLH